MFRSRVMAVASGALILTGCSSLPAAVTAPFGAPASSNPSMGYVVGDEPYAVHEGAKVLAEGGSAADAATAIYFALSVTYPVAAGLGGGGLCVVHSGATNEMLDFLPREAAGGGPYAVPGNVRGFAALQALHGRLNWQTLIAPAEEYAGTGFLISDALAKRINAAGNVIRLDATLAAEFLDQNGQPKKAGDTAQNTDLAQTLAAIRLHGAGGLYEGAVAQRLIAYSSAQNGALAQSDLSAIRANRDAVRAVPMGNIVANLPPTQLGAGAFTASLLQNLGNVMNAQAPDIAAATKRALDAFHVASLPQDMGSTGFAATDSSGEAVACAVTMNGPFGSGHTAEGTGVTLARAPSNGQAGLAGAFLTPVIATDTSGTSLVMAAAGAGGPNATASIVYALQQVAQNKALSERANLRSTGTAPYETINAIACNGANCTALADPASDGLGMAAPR